MVTIDDLVYLLGSILPLRNMKGKEHIWLSQRNLKIPTEIIPVSKS